MKAGSNEWQQSYALAQILRRVMEVAIALLPAFGIVYLYLYQDPGLRFESHAFHEMAIAMATIVGAFVSYVGWRCYLYSGEPFLKWVTVGFLGFTVVYSLHGFFTPVAHHNLWLFILYGPASRLLMSVCLLLGILRFGRAPDAPEARRDRKFWLAVVAVFMLVNGLVALLAHSPWAGEYWLRSLQEYAAAGLSATSLGIVWYRRPRSPLMSYYALALAYFAWSSISFTVSQAWNHQWWQAHAIFAVGFFLLGYGILHAYLNTQAFETVFEDRQVINELARTNSQLHQAKEHLAQENHRLEGLLQTARAVGEQFTTLFELSPLGILIVARGGEIQRVNEAAARSFGWSAEEMRRLAVEDLMPLASRTDHVRYRELYEYSAAIRNMGDYGRSVTCRRRSGTNFEASIAIGSLVYEGELCLVAFVREIDGAATGVPNGGAPDQAADGALTAEVAAAVPCMLFRLRRQANGHYDFTYASEGVRQMFECAPGELMQNASLWFSRVHPADLASLVGSLEHSAAGMQAWHAEWRVNLPIQGICLRTGESALPVKLADGSVVWTGWVSAVAAAMA